MQREARRPIKNKENITYDIKLKETIFCLSEGKREEGKIPQEFKSLHHSTKKLLPQSDLEVVKTLFILKRFKQLETH